MKANRAIDNDASNCCAFSGACHRGRLAVMNVRVLSFPDYARLVWLYTRLVTISALILIPVLVFGNSSQWSYWLSIYLALVSTMASLVNMSFVFGFAEKRNRPMRRGLQASLLIPCIAVSPIALTVSLIPGAIAAVLFPPLYLLFFLQWRPDGTAGSS